MTVSSEVSTAGPFFGNGSVKTFPYAFKILDEKHIRVVFISALGDVSDLSLENGDYTVTGVGNEAGGNVVKATPLLTGQKLTIVRRLPLTQDTSLENQGAYYPEVVEQRFDFLTMQIQSVQEATERSLTVEPGQEKPSMTQIAAAQGYAQAAKQNRDEAGQFADAASGSASSASGSATLAGRWASAPEDQEVVPTSGLFSAFHWYRKTLAIWNSVIAGWSSAVHDAPVKASPSLADEFGFADSGDSWKIKKQTFGKLQEVFGVPIGTTIMVQGNGNTPPPGFLLHNGAAVTSAYPQLRAFLLANGANVDGNGNPIIEDMGGYFPRGWRPGQVVDSGRVFGSTQQDALQDHKHRTASAIADRTTPSWGTIDGTEEFTTNSGFYANAGVAYRNLSGGAKYPVDANGTPRVAAETRPANKTFTYWIKAYAADIVPGTADLAALLNNVQVLQTSVNSSGLKKGAKASISAGTSVLYTGIPSGVSKVIFNVRGVTFGSPQGTARIRVGTPAGVLTSGYAGGYMVIAQQTGYATLPLDGTAIDMNASNSAMAVLTGQIIFTRVPGTNEWLFTGQFYATPGGYHFGMWQSGTVVLPGDFDRIQLTTIQGTAPMTAGTVWAEWETAA